MTAVEDRDAKHREIPTTPKGWLIPPKATSQWARLSEALEDVKPPCTADPDAWHAPERYETALKLCGRCPARIACADYASSAGETGVWGGQVFGQPPTRPTRRRRTRATQ